MSTLGGTGSPGPPHGTLLLLLAPGGFRKALVGGEQLQIGDTTPGQQVGGEVQGVQGPEGLGGGYLTRHLAHLGRQFPDLATSPEGIQVSPSISKLFL